MTYGRIPGLAGDVSRIVQGAASFKSRLESECFALCDTILELGGNAFDTARVYGEGDSERTLGRWVRARGVRERVVIISKGAHPSAGVDRLTAAAITADLGESLAALQTDYIDLYLLHRDDPSVPVGPLVEVLNEHRDAGRIRAFGASNWTTRRLEQANSYAARFGLEPLAASSPHFGLAEQLAPTWPGSLSLTGDRNRGERAWYLDREIALLCWSGLAGGWSIDEPRGVKEAAIRSYEDPTNRERVRRARELGHRRGLTVAQVAIAFILNQPTRPYAVIAARTAEQHRANAEAARVSLSPDELAWLNLGRPWC